MDAVLLWIVIAIVAVVAFDFTNGFHDASNMIATLVASRAMTPAQAVALVGLFTFLGPLLGGTAVADTLGGVVQLGNLSALDAVSIVTCGVFAAIAWNLITWRLGIPSSSSHALVGGLVGAVVIGASADDVVWGLQGIAFGQWQGVAKVLLTLITSPLIGFAVGLALHLSMRWLLRAAHPRVNRRLRQGQWISAAALAFAHGTNDAQKGMGIVTLLLVLGGVIDHFEVPTWVVGVSALSLTLGTLLGGWGIVRTIGFGIYKLRPLHGFNTQLSSALVIISASLVGGPVSTTHVVSTSIMGIGASERPRAVHWHKALEIALTWVFTLPGSALLGALLYGLIAVLRKMVSL